MLETGKDGVQSSNDNEANEDRSQEAIACGSSPRHSRCVTLPVPTLHDVFESSRNGGVDVPGFWGIPPTRQQR